MCNVYLFVFEILPGIKQMLLNPSQQNKYNFLPDVQEDEFFSLSDLVDPMSCSSPRADGMLVSAARRKRKKEWMSHL